MKLMRNIGSRFSLLAGMALLVLAASVSFAAELSDAEKDWEALQGFGRNPQVPAEWRLMEPTSEQLMEFRAKQKKILLEGADKAKEFYEKYPQDPNALRARRKELECLGLLVGQVGEASFQGRLEAVEKAVLADPKLREDDRFEIRQRAVQRQAMAKRDLGNEAVLAEFEKGARDLIKEFPKQSEPYEMLFTVAQQSAPEKQKAIAEEIAKSTQADGDIKKMAEGLLTKLQSVGKPIQIKFAAIDGREVDLAKLKGKVVLLDFWATWCGPCVGEIPHVLATYEKLHDKGFEVIGISFDQEKEKLVSFVAENKMPWPQYFDGKGWKNDIGQRYGIDGIPAMWLIDKKGNLQDLNARENLEAKVQKLLAE